MTRKKRQKQRRPSKANLYQAHNQGKPVPSSQSRLTSRKRKRGLSTNPFSLSEYAEQMSTPPQSYYDKGFCVYRNVIEGNPEAFDELRAAIHRHAAGTKRSGKRSKPIFNHSNVEGKPERNDNKRSSTPLSKAPKIVQYYLGVFKQFLEKSHPNLTLESCFSLHSKPGCGPQVPHTDFPMYSGIPQELAPVSALAGVMPSTIDVWPGSHKLAPLEVDELQEQKAIESESIKYGKGDVVIWDFNLFHAGAAFSAQNIQDNIRIHAYGEQKKSNLLPEEHHVKRERGKTYLISSLKEPLQAPFQKLINNTSRATGRPKA